MDPEAGHDAQPQPPLANILTIGVSDIDRQRRFYTDLGWPVVLDSAGFVVFELRGALLALFPLSQLSRDAQAAPPSEDSAAAAAAATAAAAQAGVIRSAVIITAEQPDEVDAWVERARRAGATVTKEPTTAEFFEGRDAYFADPEGNFWEVAWTPVENAVSAAARRAAGLAP